MTKICHNHRQQAKSWHIEKETKEHRQGNIHKNKYTINQYKPSILLMGHRQTVQTQIRRHILIRRFTVSLQNVLLKFDKGVKIHPIPQ